MGSFSIWHWLIVLLIVVLDFRHQEAEEHRLRPRRRRQGLQGRHEGRLGARRAGAAAAGHQRPQAADAEHRRRGGQAQELSAPAADRDVAAFRMIDFGFDKIALIGAVALIVIGPEKLPRVARTVGTLMGKAQRYVADVKAEVNRSIELEELKKMKTQFEDAARDVESRPARSGARAREPAGATAPASGATPMTPRRAAGRAAARIPASQEEVAPQARRYAQWYKAPTASARRRSRARRGWRASARRKFR